MSKNPLEKADLSKQIKESATHQIPGIKSSGLSAEQRNSYSSKTKAFSLHWFTKLKIGWSDKANHAPTRFVSSFILCLSVDVRQTNSTTNILRQYLSLRHLYLNITIRQLTP